MNKRQIATGVIFLLLLIAVGIFGFVYVGENIDLSPKSNFIQSLLAGFLVLLIDALLIAVIVNFVTKYRENSRWRFARKRFIYSLLETLNTLSIYIDKRIYAAICNSDLAEYLPNNIRKLLDNNFSHDFSINDIDEILTEFQQRIDHGSYVVNAELADFIHQLQQKHEYLKSYLHFFPINTRVVCDSKYDLRQCILDPLIRFHKSAKEMRIFTKNELNGKLHYLIGDISEPWIDNPTFENMYADLLKDFDKEFDELNFKEKAKFFLFRKKWGVLLHENREGKCDN